MRRTHDYPYGKPEPLLLVEAGSVIVGVAWLILFSWGWPYRIATASAFVALGIVHSKLVRGYERTGEAVRIPRAVAVSYATGLPVVLRGTRIAFFVVVAVILFFGLAPVPLNVAHVGIIVCILSLFLVGFLHFVAERHYVATGRATEDYENPR